MGREHRIDLYQFHDNGFPAENARPVRDTLEELVKEGKIRAYGWSTDFPKSAEFFAQGENCSAIQLQLNVLADNAPVVEICEKYDQAAINRGPLAMGLLTGKYTVATKVTGEDVRSNRSPEWLSYFKDGKPHPKFMERVDAVRDILTSDGRSIAQGSLAWLWARSETTVPIPGFRTVQQVEDNAAAQEKGPLTPAEFAEIEGLLRPA